GEDVAEAVAREEAGGEGDLDGAGFAAVALGPVDVALVEAEQDRGAGGVGGGDGVDQAAGPGGVVGGSGAAVVGQGAEAEVGDVLAVTRARPEPAGVVVLHVVPTRVDRAGRAGEPAVGAGAAD